MNLADTVSETDVNSWSYFFQRSLTALSHMDTTVLMLRTEFALMLNSASAYRFDKQDGPQMHNTHTASR